MPYVTGHYRSGRWVRGHWRRSAGATGSVTALALGIAVVAAMQGGGGQDRRQQDDAPPATSLRQRASAAAVIDGDTLRVTVRGAQERVRLLAVDTPEVDQYECYADEATTLTAQLVRSADQVVLVVDPTQPDRDRYGRLLRYVRLDGTDLGSSLVESGAAEVWVGTPPAARLDRYRALEGEARAASAGRWGQCAAAT